MASDRGRGMAMLDGRLQHSRTQDTREKKRKKPTAYGETFLCCRSLEL